MKKIFIAVALMMLFGSLAYGQKKMTVEQTLTNIEQEMTNSLVKGDASVFDKYAADTTVFTDPGGNVMNKAELIAQIKSGNFKFESIKDEDIKVRMFGNTAIVTYRSTIKGAITGRDISGQYRWTDTFVKMGGKWMIVALQGTMIAP